MTDKEVERIAAPYWPNDEITPIELLPRTARNSYGQRATLWTTAGVEHQLRQRARNHLQGTHDEQ